MHFSERMRLSFPGTQSQSGCTGVEARKLKAVWSFVPIPFGEAISILGALLPQPTAGKACRSTQRMAQAHSPVSTLSHRGDSKGVSSPLGQGAESSLLGTSFLSLLKGNSAQEPQLERREGYENE